MVNRAKTGDVLNSEKIKKMRRKVEARGEIAGSRDLEGERRGERERGGYMECSICDLSNHTA